MMRRAALAWLGLMVLAILNGGFREALLVPALGPAAAHIASTAILCVLIAGYTWLAVPWLGPRAGRDALLIGALWLLLTLAFEFGFGYFVAGLSWAELLAEYDVAAGRVWVIVPILVFVAPYLAGRLRGLF